MQALFVLQLLLVGKVLLYPFPDEVLSLEEGAAQSNPAVLDRMPYISSPGKVKNSQIYTLLKGLQCNIIQQKVEY